MITKEVTDESLLMGGRVGVDANATNQRVDGKQGGGGWG